MEERKNIKLTLAYDGSRYHGWQRQKNGKTIQAVLEGNLQLMTREQIRLIASGRTDAGVHALNQVCHFLTRTSIPLSNLKRGLNSLLPDDIFIRQADYVPLEFHARYSAKSKTYEYRIFNQQEPDIFQRSHSWQIQKSLNLRAMKQCLAVLEGRHDFSAFKSAGSNNKNPIREMIKSELKMTGKGQMILLFEADGFLRHMVRNIVGTIVEVGLGKKDFGEFIDIFQSKNRCRAGIKAPPQGLFLVAVKY